MEDEKNNNSIVSASNFQLDETPLKLSKSEKKKYRVVMQVINGEINGTQAAKKLGITTRQVRNIKRRIIDEGKKGIIHRNKNYKPHNTYDEEVSTMVCKLYRKEFKGINFSSFARICQEEYGVEASRSTIYNFLRKGHIRSPQRKAKKKRVTSFDEQGNKVISVVRVYDRDTINYHQGKKVLVSTKTILKKDK